MVTPNTFRIIIQTPEGLVLDAMAVSARLHGVDGDYGVLWRHAPMLATTAPGILRVTFATGCIFHYFVSDGIAWIASNCIKILCDASERSDEIDAERAWEAAERARVRLHRRFDGTVDMARAEAALRRAVCRLQIANGSGGFSTMNKTRLTTVCLSSARSTG